MEKRASINSDGKLNILFAGTRIRVNILSDKKEIELANRIKNIVIPFLESLPYMAVSKLEDLDEYAISDEKISDMFKLNLSNDEDLKIVSSLKQIAVLFIKSHLKNKEPNLIKRFEKEPEYLFSVVLAGAAGVGKSTLIKAISGFSNDFYFPTINSSRTTLYSTDFIYVSRDNYRVSDNSYQFPCYFEFREDWWLLERLAEYIYNAVKNYLLKVLENEFSTEQIYISFESLMNVFLNNTEDQLLVLKLVLGEPTEDSAMWTDLHKEIIEFGKNIWNDILEKKSLGILNFNDKDSIINEIDNLLKKSNIPEHDLTKFLLTHIKILINDVLSEMKSIDKHEVFINEVNGNVHVVEFQYSVIPSNKDGDLLQKHSDNAVYFERFTSRDADKKGGLLTPLIKFAKIVLPVNSEIDKEFSNNFPGILISDTVGVSHSNDLESGINNLNLSQQDLILMLDNATDAMGGDAINLLTSMISNVDLNRLAIAYSHIFELHKDDWNSAEDDEAYERLRNNYLITLQTQALNKILDTNDYEESRKLYILETLKNNTTILNFEVDMIRKGRVKYPNISHRDNTVSIIKKLVNLYNNLNAPADFDFDIDYISLKPFNDEKFKLLYNAFRTGFITSQKDLYFYHYPQYKVTEALASRLSRRYYDPKLYNLAYYGAKNLTPAHDCHFQIMKYINKQLNDIKVTIIDNSSNNKSQHIYDLKKKDQLIIWKKIDKDKEKLSQIIEKIVCEILQEKSDEFLIAYNYWGTGSDYSRRKKLVEIFEMQILPEFSRDTTNNVQLFKWYNNFRILFSSI